MNGLRSNTMAPVATILRAIASRWIWMALVVALLLAPSLVNRAAPTGVAAGAVAAPTGVPVGMNFGSGYEATFQGLSSSAQSAVIQRLVSSGVTWLRVDVPFDGEEDTSGNFYWTSNTEIQLAEQAGIHVLATLGFSPTWATLSDGSPNPTKFAAFAAAAVAHYSPMGVQDYEIWNEMNLSTYWKANPSPAEYTTLLKATYPAIKAADSQATVVTGGMAPAPDAIQSISPLTFLTEMYQDGAGGYFDAVGDHPYSYPDIPQQPDAWNPFTYLPQMHALMAANGDGNKQIWYTEYGAPTGGPKAVSESLQATMYTDAFQMARTWTWSGPIFAFDWQDDSIDGPFGVNDDNGNPKPALAALTQASSGSSTPTTTTATTPVPAGIDLGLGYESTFAAMTPAAQAQVVQQFVSNHVAWLRVDVLFNGEENSKGVLTWTNDALVKDAIAAGIHVDAVIWWSPVWALNSDGSPSVTPYVSFAQAAVTHYSAMGVHTYELWNRPNSANYWGAPVNPVEYTALVKATYPAIKAIDPTSVVLLGALDSYTDTGTTFVSPLTFLTSLYKDGIAGSFDAVAVDPYTWEQIPLQPTSTNPWVYMPQVHSLMAANGDGNKQIWLTEWGQPTAGSGAVTPAVQATMITEGFQVASTWAWSGPLFVANWEDDTANGDYGLLYSNGTAKPALAAYSAAAAPTATAPAQGGWQLNGTAALSGTTLQLNPATDHMAGSAFWTTAIDPTSVNATYTSTMGPGTGADGMAFVIVPSSDGATSLGTGSSAYGWGHLGGVAIVEDTYQHVNDPCANLVGVTDSENANGPVWLATSCAVPNLHGSHTISVTENNGTITVSVDGTRYINVAGVPIPSSAFLGFTGATGGLADVHSVSNTAITY